MKRIFEKINFRQPKYMLPAILYIPLLGASYFIFDLFNAEKAEIADKTLQTTEFLNPDLPDATIKGGDGIGSKYENMAKSWGKIADYTAVNNIERDEPDDDKEKYESQYSQDEVALLGELEQQKLQAEEAADAKTREQEALKELERALAEARLKAQVATVEPLAEDSLEQHSETGVSASGTISEDSQAVNAPSESEEPGEMVKKVKVTSDYFNTIAQNENEPNLIKAILDEDVKAVDGSRVRLRLLDDVEINETVVKSGSYLYAIMSGFSSQRVKGTINSVLVNDEIIKVSLSLYDTDGLEGLYVPSSSFRETSKDVASGAFNNMSMNTGGNGNSLTQWGMQAIQNAYQKTSNAISKNIKKNKVNLKYGTFVYIINSQEKRNAK